MKQKKYREYKELDFSAMAGDILRFWKEKNIFEQSVTNREGCPLFTFYEGPPSANGKPGIHHVMARTVKDIFCRLKTLQGYQVKRKGGWDTHGLPVELEVEKKLGITKEDIGNTISILEYNEQCRKTVMQYKEQWDDLTVKMGYWVDLQNPYITYKKEYIESLWWILKTLYKKNLLYKGYNIQPYSPAAGTGLSSHELNLPGVYKEVKDLSIVAKFEIIRNTNSEFLYTQTGTAKGKIYALAWTTTPWTLPANTALAIGSQIRYLIVHTINPYTKKPATVLIAKKAFARYFYLTEDRDIAVGIRNTSHEITTQGKITTWEILDEQTGQALVGLCYKQLMPYIPPKYNTNNAFKVIAGDFVTTKEGTGIVHIAPTFGADDFKAAKLNHIPSIGITRQNQLLPIVDQKGKFVTPVGKQLVEGIHKYGIKTHRALSEDDFYVKNYTEEDETLPNYKSTDTIISIILKMENKAFKVEKYQHTYPHCWRTNKPVLYYPLNAWFIRTTTLKKRMVELNKTINWKPASTGTGRFGNWLENLVDWNLSRSRYWGTPIPIWSTQDGKETICIGSIKELAEEVEKARKAGVDNPKIDCNTFDPHRPHTDEIILVSPTGKPMYREHDLVDVWFDSGSMPYAQWHYPFENRDTLAENFPADYIAEGVDQTRGWFFTLHAIAAMLFDSIAFKNVIANGLVLDKEGNKMSKSKGNSVDPFYIIEKYGPDATRWYMIENAPPWENLKFDEDGIIETKRKFFGTLVNVYSFFALYANIDKFTRQEKHEITKEPYPYIDQWIISCLHSLIVDVTAAYNDYEPTRAARAVQKFVNNQLSNWYIRLNRKRFWQPKAEQESQIMQDKEMAYHTLYECLMTVSQLMAPITPFFSEWLYKNLIGPNHSAQSKNNGLDNPISIHLTQLVKANPRKINRQIELSMSYAQRISSLVHSIRKKSKIKVRVPLQKILIPIVDDQFESCVQPVEDIIKNEVNVKALEYIRGNSDVIIKKAKPNYSKLGKQYGTRIKEVVGIINTFTKKEIELLEKQGKVSKSGIDFTNDDVFIHLEDVSGWAVATENNIIVALDITITEALQKEGIARDFVNRVQNLRKQMNLEVTDKITIDAEAEERIVEAALKQFKEYICTETQAVALMQKKEMAEVTEVEMDEHRIKLKINTL